MNPPDHPLDRGTSTMKDLQPILIVAAVFAAWFALNRWILPRLGVGT